MSKGMKSLPFSLRGSALVLVGLFLMLVGLQGITGQSEVNVILLAGGFVFLIGIATRPIWHCGNCGFFFEYQPHKKPN